MFKLNYEINEFSFKIYEDKFDDNSILRMEIIIQDENKHLHQQEFVDMIEKIKIIIEDDRFNFNTYKVLLKLLRAEELDIFKNKNDHISPVKIFPQFELIREFDDGKKEYKGIKNISWKIFKQFSDNLNHIAGGINK